MDRQTDGQDAVRVTESRQQRRARERAEAKAATRPGPRPIVLNEPDPDDDFTPPPESAFDTSGCPVDSRCVGCGAQGELGVMISMFGGDAACATVCPNCDGRSMIHLVGLDGLDARVAAHRAHRANR